MDIVLHKQVQEPFLSAIMLLQKTKEARCLSDTWSLDLVGKQITLGDGKTVMTSMKLLSCGVTAMQVYSANTLEEAIHLMLDAEYDYLCGGLSYTKQEAYDIYWAFCSPKTATCTSMGVATLQVRDHPKI